MSGGSVCVHMACKEPRFLSALVAVAFAPAPRGSDFLFPIPGAYAPGYVSVVLRTLEFRSLRSHLQSPQIAIYRVFRDTRVTNSEGRSEFTIYDVQGTID